MTGSLRERESFINHFNDASKILWLASVLKNKKLARVLKLVDFTGRRVLDSIVTEWSY